MTLISNSNNDFYPEILNQLANPSSSKEKQEFLRKKYDQLISKVYFSEGDERRNKNNDLMPFIYFYKYLARKPDGNPPSNINRLRLWLPDTIVYNDGDNPPMWFYSSEQGYVYRTDSFHHKNITTKLGNYASQDELVAIVKNVCIFFFF